VYLKFVRKLQRLKKFEAGGDSRKTNYRALGSDVEPGCSPHRVLSFLHVAEEHAEMDNACGIGFVKLNASRESELAQYGLLGANTWNHWSLRLVTGSSIFNLVRWWRSAATVPLR
jgi:hypothetical protein